MSYDQVRHEIDFPRLMALNRYWRHSPPVHLLMKTLAAQHLGWKPPEDPAKREAVNEEVTAERFLAGLTFDELQKGGF